MKRRMLLLAVFVAVVPLGLLVMQSPYGAGASQAYASSGKRITISLAKQRLRAWEGKRVVLVTPVTTGNPALPTPTGHFAIFAKYSPYTMVSPWPYGSPYWYPTSGMSFAMEFARGYFIHDAPWRSVFGRASQGNGQPGSNYGGTHGCVNVPYSAERFLFSWAPIGTPVHIVP